MFQSKTSDRIIDFDTEFYDNGSTVELISIGMVRDDGDRLYLINPDFQGIRNRVEATAPDRWVIDNVLNPDILMEHDPKIPSAVSEMAHWIADFCGPNPIFCTYCGAYDTVAMRSMFGRMINSPQSWPYTYLDLAVPFQMLGRKSSRDYPQQGMDEQPEHNAMSDAVWTQRVRKQLTEETGRMNAGLQGILRAGIVTDVTANDQLLAGAAAYRYLTHVPR